MSGLRPVIRALCASFAIAGLSACGDASEHAAESAAPALQEAGGPDRFTPALFDPNRPCTLLSREDASRILHQPFFRTIAADRVEDNTVKCSHAVGVGGLHGLVEAQIILPDPGEPAELAYVALCRARLDDTPKTDPDEAPYRVAGESVIHGRACRLAGGGYAILMADRILVATVRGSAGEIDEAGAERLAAMLSRRVSAPS